jgi:hypothetical protein
MSARPAPPDTAWIRSLRVEGYRAFGAPLQLDELGRVVVLYGLNNAGKTNLLRAVEMLSRLVDQPLVRILDDTPEPQDAFYRRMAQDPWMFTQGRPPVMRIQAELAPSGDSVGFEVTREDERVRIRLTRWFSGGVDVGTPAAAARRRLVASLREDTPDVAAQEEVAKADARWDSLRRSLRAAWGGSWLPISAEVRTAFVQQGRIADLSLRARARQARETYARVVQGLPSPGSLQDLSASPPSHPVDGAPPPGREDVAWVTESVLLPLDHLGSGAQAVFGMLASLALARASVVLVDEPEQHLNVLQQEAVLDALTNALDSRGVGQLFLATHSVKFAKPDLDLRRIQRTEASAHAEKVTSPMLSAFEARGPAAPRTESPSMVAHDGSVELPSFVREALGIQPGEFVYFKRDPKGGFRLMSAAAMDAAIGDE